jgi:transposase
MLNKFNKIPDFTGHDVFVGLDVHKGSWAVNIIVDDMKHRSFTQPPDPVALSNYLTVNFPGATYFSAYESGFCGYHHHRKLLELGIQNIVINPADLPVTDKEKNNKRDPLDSKRISSYLQKDLLSAIHVFDPAHEQFRSLCRMRWTAAKENRRTKNRIRAFYGMNPPAHLKPQYWSNKLVHWIEELNLSYNSGTLALKYLISDYLKNRQLLLEVTKNLRRQVKLLYPDIYTLLLSVPGVGPLTAMHLIAEIGDISRFRSYKQLASFVGLVPRSHQSGEKDFPGQLTYRSNKYLRALLVESAWTAVQHDPALMLYFKERLPDHKSQHIIIKVAHKLLNRIRNVWISHNAYCKGLS